MSKTDHKHVGCFGLSLVTAAAGKYSPAITEAVTRGFLELMQQQDPSRLSRWLSQVRDCKHADDVAVDVHFCEREKLFQDDWAQMYLYMLD
jgi:hypothetical protein